jgi:hypothetical protein
LSLVSSHCRFNHAYANLSLTGQDNKQPGPKAWKTWREALQLHLSTNGKFRRLRQPLGKWTISQLQTKQERCWYIDPNTGKLFQRDSATFHIYQAAKKGTRFDPNAIGMTAKLPSNVIPITVNDFTIEKIPRNQHWETTKLIQVEPATFKDYIDQLDDWERNLLKRTGNVQDTADITTRITESKKTYMVSDGGMVNRYGLYGWIIANENEISKGKGEAEEPKI